MVAPPEVRLVVKHTFLEFVQHGGGRARALTDTALLESDGEGRHGGKSPPQSGNDSTSHTGEASTHGPLYIDNDRTSRNQTEEGPAARASQDDWRCDPVSRSPPPGGHASSEVSSPAHETGCAEAAQAAGNSSCSSSSSGSSQTGDEWRTTVMLRNLPNNYTRDMLMELVDTLGFNGQYDLIYFPVDFRTGAGLGYAFVNLCTPRNALKLWKRLEGFSRWALPSQKVCSVTWSHPHQGLESHVARYRNSPVMHPAVPDRWKPALFERGTRVAFPGPTKKLKMPRTTRLDLAP